MSRALQVVVDAMSLGSLYALMALGIALIFGVMRFINFAHGEFVMVGAYVVYYLQDYPAAIKVAAALGAGLLVALATERVAFRPVRNATATTLLGTSFAVSFFLQYLVILVIGAEPRAATITQSFGQTIEIGSVRVAVLDLEIIGTTLVLLAILAFFLKKTAWGLDMRAAALDFEMARLLGVRANRVIAVAFGLSGFLAAAVTVFLVQQNGIITPTMGLTAVLVAFVATVIGGLGSLGGAVTAGFGLGFVSVLLQTYLPLSMRPFRDAFLFGLVIAVLLLRPQGLFGKSAEL